jgi:hypothetical protein
MTGRVVDPTLNLDGDADPRSLPCGLLVPFDLDWEFYESKLVNTVPADGPYYPYCTDVAVSVYMECVIQ